MAQEKGKKKQAQKKSGPRALSRLRNRPDKKGQLFEGLIF
jgi:hypothetical protein